MLLRAIHRGGGVADQALGRCPRIRGHGDPHARGHERLPDREVELAGEHIHHPCGGFAGLPVRVDPFADHDELVGPQPGDRVGWTHRAEEALPHRDEDEVAGRVSEPVVHFLESIQVQEQHGDAGAPSPESCYGLLEAVEEETPVRQTGDRIVEGIVHQGRLDPLTLSSGPYDAPEHQDRHDGRQDRVEDDVRAPLADPSAEQYNRTDQDRRAEHHRPAPPQRRRLRLHVPFSERAHPGMERGGSQGDVAEQPEPVQRAPEGSRSRDDRGQSIPEEDGEDPAEDQPESVGPATGNERQSDEHRQDQQIHQRIDRRDGLVDRRGRGGRRRHDHQAPDEDAASERHDDPIEEGVGIATPFRTSEPQTTCRHRDAGRDVQRAGQGQTRRVPAYDLPVHGDRVSAHEEGEPDGQQDPWGDHRRLVAPDPDHHRHQAHCPHPVVGEAPDGVVVRQGDEQESDDRSDQAERAMGVCDTRGVDGPPGGL